MERGGRHVSLARGVYSAAFRTCRNEATSCIRHCLSAISLYGEREKRALEALLVSFSTLRNQKLTTGILVSGSKQNNKKVHSSMPTVRDFFVFQPREPAYLTYVSSR